MYRGRQPGDVAKEVGLKVGLHLPILSPYRIRVNAIRELAHAPFDTTRALAKIELATDYGASDDLEIITLRLPLRHSPSPGSLGERTRRHRPRWTPGSFRNAQRGSGQGNPR
jgi:hypothetical protein